MKEIEIKNAINAIPVCSDGKRAIGNLVASIFKQLGKDFDESFFAKPSQGEIWLVNNGRIGLVTDEGNLVTLGFVDSKFYQNERKEIGYINGIDFDSPDYVVKLANSVEEYLANRDALNQKAQSLLT